MLRVLTDSSCASVHIDSVTSALKLSFCLRFLTGEIERQMGQLGAVVAQPLIFNL